MKNRAYVGVSICIIAFGLVRYLDVSAGGVVIGGMMHEKLIDEVSQSVHYDN